MSYAAGAEVPQEVVPVRVRIGVQKQPAHLRTAAQMVASGYRLLPGQAPVGWLEREMEGDVWTTALYDVSAAQLEPVPVPSDQPELPPTAPPANEAPVEMCAVNWSKRMQRWSDGVEYYKPSKRHITLNGEVTHCGTAIPDDATLEPVTLERWHMYTDCYNCAYRLWPDYGPADHIRPENSADFPPRRIR